MAAGFWSHAGIQPGTPTSKFKPWKRRAWPGNKWSNGNRMLWWAFVGTSCLWLEYGIFSNSIKISDPNIQYPARSHLFRSFPGCFWGSIIFNRSQSPRAQIPGTLSPSLAYFKSLIFVHYIIQFDQTLGKKKLQKNGLAAIPPMSEIGIVCWLRIMPLVSLRKFPAFSTRADANQTLNPWTPSPPNCYQVTPDYASS